MIIIEYYGSDLEIYGVIPYVSSEIFQGKKFTLPSDIQGFQKKKKLELQIHSLFYNYYTKFNIRS